MSSRYITLLMHNHCLRLFAERLYLRATPNKHDSQHVTSVTPSNPEHPQFSIRDTCHDTKLNKRRVKINIVKKNVLEKTRHLGCFLSQVLVNLNVKVGVYVNFDFFRPTFRIIGKV